MFKNVKIKNPTTIIYHKSDKGNTRAKNEDYSWAGTNNLLDNLLIVSDGVGSYEGSEKASEIVSKVFIKSFLNLEYISIDVNKWFDKNIIRAKKIMKEHIKSNRKHAEMATTLVLALIVKKEAHIFWIGDSRAYLITKKSASMITEDHNLLNYLININATREQIEGYKNYLNSITNSISCNKHDNSKQKYDYLNFKLKINNFIFLASDGFYNFYTDINNLYDRISNDLNKEYISRELVNAAIANDSNDNISFSYCGYIKESI